MLFLCNCFCRAFRLLLFKENGLSFISVDGYEYDYIVFQAVTVHILMDTERDSVSI